MGLNEAYRLFKRILLGKDQLPGKSHSPLEHRHLIVVLTLISEVKIVLNVNS